ncbi:MAG: hypothetical protein KDA25_07445, partial [Phycisphaerales bacterium]|nr:hypothetical protein [Phycisphaerales bacterium]
MTSLAAAAHPPVTNRGADLKALTGALCAFDTGVVAPDNEAFFRRLGDEVPLRLERHPSGARHLGWIVPPRRVVRRAVISRDGTVLYDGAAHPLGVAAQSRGVRARLAWDDLRPHLVS